MSNTKKTTNKPAEDATAVLQALIAQGRKEGMIRASDLNAQLEKLDLSPEKIEEIYDRFEAMNIQIIGAELDLDLGDDLGDGLDDDLDLSDLKEEDLIDPVDRIICRILKADLFPQTIILTFPPFPFPTL